MEKARKPPDKEQKPREEAKRPPGEFVTNELEEHTARFLRELKGLAKRREQAKSEESPGPPPREPRDDQRSRRR